MRGGGGGGGRIKERWGAVRREAGVEEGVLPQVPQVPGQPGVEGVHSRKNKTSWGCAFCTHLPPLERKIPGSIHACAGIFFGVES